MIMRTIKNSGRPLTAESAQVTVLFALMMTAMMAMLALVVDLGFVYGQRRIDQNGSDSAALAGGRDLASHVSTLCGSTCFTATDAGLYTKVQQYVTNNLNARLTGRNTMSVTLEYCAKPTHTDGSGNKYCKTDSDPKKSDWCYSPSGPQPVRNPLVPSCADANSVTPLLANPLDPTNAAVKLPPAPDSTYPFRLRVTVSSTTNGFFAAVASMNGGAPSAPSDEAQAACVRPSGAKGNTTCAQAIVVVSGAPDSTVGPIIPVTTGDCQLGGDPSSNYLFQLWGSQPVDCGYSIPSNWKNLLDFSTETAWCDGATYDYQLGSGSTGNVNMLPSQSNCAGATSPDGGWQRSGFAPDTSRPGGTDATNDLIYWISKTYSGTIRGTPTPPAPTATSSPPTRKTPGRTWAPTSQTASTATPPATPTSPLPTARGPCRRPSSSTPALPTSTTSAASPFRTTSTPARIPAWAAVTWA